MPSCRVVSCRVVSCRVVSCRAFVFHCVAKGTKEAFQEVKAIYLEALQIVTSNKVGEIAPSPDGKGVGGAATSGGGSGAAGGVRQELLGEIAAGRAQLRKVPEEELNLAANVTLTTRDVLLSAIKSGGDAPLKDATARQLKVLIGLGAALAL